MTCSRMFPGIAVLGWLMVCSLPCLVDAGEVVVPVRVRASSNQGTGGESPRWHVETLRLGARHFDATTGTNTPYGLVGFPGCTANEGPRRPGHDHYVHDDAGVLKPRGMWMSARGDTSKAWVEFELPKMTELSELWIWNWNDAPEIGRRVRQLTIQTSSKTTRPGQLEAVDYNVDHGVQRLPNIGRVEGRLPDLVFKFPAGTHSRYLRLDAMKNYGAKDALGLAEVFLLTPSKKGVNESSKVGGPITKAGGESNWQLFLDNHVIARSTGFQRVLHHPRRRGIVLKADKPWETHGVVPMYVGQRKNGTYECYYQTLWRNRGGGSTNAMAYATSKDGIHWVKPILNLVEAPTTIHPHRRLPLGVSSGSGKANNLVPTGHPRDLHRFGNVTDPKKHFAMTKRFQINGKLAFASETPDFLGDPGWRAKLIDSGGFKPSHYNALEFWDDLHQEWVYMRQAPNHPPVRCGGRYATRDFKKWTLEHFIYPDAEDSTDPRSFDEIYGVMSVHVEGIVLGFLEWFKGDRTHPNPNLYEDGHNRPTTSEGVIGKSVSKGTMEIRVATSRDGGMTWDRGVSRQPWIRHGSEEDSEDRLVRLVCPPLHKGDEDWFYCYIYNGDHSAGSGYYHDRDGVKIEGALYTQKHNRYVSLTAGNVPQILITRPIKVTGKRLQLNVDASRGRVVVGIGIDKVIPHKTGAWKFQARLPHYMVLDRWRQSHLEKGLGLADCLPIRTNCIAQDVQFKTGTLQPLLGKTVRLYILVENADLYGFRFQ